MTLHQREEEGETKTERSATVTTIVVIVTTDQEEVVAATTVAAMAREPGNMCIAHNRFCARMEQV